MFGHDYNMVGPDGMAIANNPAVTGEFVGISKEGLENNLIPAITTYCTNIENLIDEFNSAANAATAFKGDTVLESLTTYLETAKQALADYVNKLRIEEQRAREALEAWTEGTSNVASSVTDMASEIRTAGSNFTLD